MRKVIVIVLSCLFATPAFAVTGISFGIKGGLVTSYEQPGFVLPENDPDQMTLAGVQVRVSTLPMVDFILTGEYAWKTEQYTVLTQPFELKRRDLLFTASVIYPLKLTPISPYLGGGIGSHSLGYDYVEPLSWSLDANGFGIPENTTRTGYHLIGGLDLKIPAFPFSINAEFRMNWINTPGELTKYNSLAAGLNFSFL